MRQTGKTEFRVGLTVVISVILLVWVLAWVKNVTLFEDEKTLQISFDAVAGLESGDEVSINGVRKGYIENIVLKDDRVLVTAKLDEDTDIREDAKFQIMMLDLMGGKKLEINPGSSSAQIDYDIVHQGRFVGDITTAMAMLSGVEGDLKTIVHELTITLNSMNDLIADKDFRDGLVASVKKLNRIADQMSVLISENRQGIKTLVDSSNSLIANSNSFITENRQNISSTIESTKELLESSNQLVTNMDSLLSEVTNKGNNLGKLLYDEDIITDLKESLEEVKKLTKIIVEQLENDGINIDLF